MLLFDGACGLCHRVVRVLLRLDRTGRLRFAPLQGPAAQAYLRSQRLPTADFDSLVFVPDWSGRATGPAADGCLRRTDGVIAALRTVGGVGRAAAAVLVIFPAAWRDAGYRLVARWRYRVFGEWHARPLRRVDWAARFIA